MNGYEATEIIRSTKNLNSATPVYALTADIYTEISEKHANHFKEVLRKPIEVDQLYKALSVLD
jgi:CheY-like chemotaxis protein